MSSHKKAALILISLMLALISACTGSGTRLSSEQLLQKAEDEGIISWGYGSGESEAEPLNLAPVEIGDIVSVTDMWIRVYMPIQKLMYFERDDGRLKGVYVSNFDLVNKGDVLAEIVYDTHKLEADHSILLLTIEQFEEHAESETARFTQLISDLRNSYNRSTDATERQVLRLRIEKQELDYEWFLSQTERTRADYAQQLANIEEGLSGEKIIAPYDGIVTRVCKLEKGDIVRSSDLILNIIDDSAFRFYVLESPSVFRYGDLIESTREVTGSDMTVTKDDFIMRVVSDPMVLESYEDKYTCIVEPADMAAFRQWLADSRITRREIAAMTISAYPIREEALGVPIIPTNSIRVENDTRYVFIYENGLLIKRYITIGLAANGQTQVVCGLEAGQMVVTRF